MSIQTIRSQIATLKASLTPKLPRVEIYFYSQRQASDVDDATHFHYDTTEERDAIRERLHALPDGPDVHRIIIHGITAEEIAEHSAEQEAAVQS
jgi:hypothetical protein